MSVEMSTKKSQTMEVRRGLIACIAIGNYDGSEYSNLPVDSDVANLKKLCNFLSYDFIERPNKVHWTEEDVKSFLMNDIGNNLFAKNGKPEYDVLIICFSGHGLRDRVITSDGQSMDRTALHRMISINFPEIRDIPRIFVFDACAGPRECIPKGTGLQHVVAVSSEDMSDELKSSDIATSIDSDDIKVEEACTNFTKNLDYKLAVIHAANIGFQARMRSDEVGSLLLYLFTTKLSKNIANHEKKVLSDIMDEIQKELHDAGKQQIECTFNNGTRNLRVEMKRHKVMKIM